MWLDARVEGACVGESELALCGGLEVDGEELAAEVAQLVRVAADLGEGVDEARDEGVEGGRVHGPLCLLGGRRAGGGGELRRRGGAARGRGGGGGGAVCGRRRERRGGRVRCARMAMLELATDRPDGSGIERTVSSSEQR